MVVRRGTQHSDFLSGSNDPDYIYGFDGDDTLQGLDGADYLSGGRGDDTLEGGKGNDELAGNEGNDTMRGGLDDDIYWVDNLGDVVIENANEGLDTVFATFSGYELPDHVENGVLSVWRKSGHFDLIGNSLDNKLSIMHGHTGPSSIALEGKAGDDILNGSSIGDRLFGGDDDDLINGRRGDDWVDGGNGYDRLYGHEGRDTLSGFESNHNDVDRMWGGTEADTFVLGWSDLSGNRIHYSRGWGHAIIEDFNSNEDKIQLAGNLDRSDYSLGTGNWRGGARDTGIYYRNNLIGIILNHSWIGQDPDNLNADYFKYDDA